jgi:hypothetical protein
MADVLSGVALIKNFWYLNESGYHIRELDDNYRTIDDDLRNASHQFKIRQMGYKNF